ncbi:HBL/NHE enterotoxin family protein [Streptomyces albireticuli]|uniref:Uncharacterized protein n=1 Tax=Streptomyces albireticuli TaxID=1940 RepID=A0A2A2DGY8_9ACTN|nr:HBL/NHE enterotoxin family protein [Streptomyces albireticuli]MCD9166205.1 alpha-helical pore-forming toxin family protein [Streptomyces albireticuli]MCD9196523.1 alpha-helical pore-forming toxin family protein [Streptomyces albireticuli]PAU50669.1 hypothetical protein CK936_01310 [Streptomyces albireticuli]
MTMHPLALLDQEGFGAKEPREIFSVWHLLSAASTVVQSQAPLDLSLIPTLKDNQALARDHSGKWRDTYQQQLMQPLTDIKSYSNSVAAFLPQLDQLAADIKKGDKSARKKFDEALGELSKGVETREKSLKNSIDRVNDFKNLVDDDNTRFESSAEEMSKKYTGDKGEIEKIRVKLSGLEETLKGLNEEISKGLTDAIPAAIVTGVEIALAFEGLPEGKAVIDAVLGFTKDAKAADLSAMWKDAKELYGKAMEIKEVGDKVKKAVEQPGVGESILDVLKRAEATRKKAKDAIGEYGSALTALKGLQLQVGVFTTLQSNVTLLSHRIEKSMNVLEEVKSLWQRERDRLRSMGVTAQGDPMKLSDEISNAGMYWIFTGQASSRFQGIIEQPFQVNVMTPLP